MRGMILVAALMTSGTALAVDSSTFQSPTAGELAQICTLPPDHALHANAMGFCHGILFGAYRYYEATVSAEYRFVCPPVPAQTRAEIMGGYAKWLSSHAQYRNDSAVDALFRYLGETYPCGK